MRIKSGISSIMTLGLVLLLAACVPLNTEMSPLSTATVGSVQTLEESTNPIEPPSVTPEPGTAVVIGQAVLAKTGDSAQLVGMPVRLAQVFWNADKSDGAFVLEGATSPSTLIQEDGSFVFLNVLPADYVIVVGDPFGQNAIITEPDGKARVITVEAGKTFDVGKLEVTLKSP